jgi:hypothetical protein
LAVAANRFAKITFAAKMGRKLIAMAVTARAATSSESSQLAGTSQFRARLGPSSPYMVGSGGVRRCAVTSTAASTARSTPANTSELTIQVVPNKSAKPVTLLVSSSRNAAPSSSRSRYDHIATSESPHRGSAPSPPERALMASTNA